MSSETSDVSRNEILMKAFMFEWAFKFDKPNLYKRSDIFKLPEPYDDNQLIFRLDNSTHIQILHTKPLPSGRYELELLGRVKDSNQKIEFSYYGEKFRWKIFSGAKIDKPFKFRT